MTVRTNTTGWHSSVDKGRRLDNEDTFCHGSIQFDNKCEGSAEQPGSSSKCTGSSTNNARELLVAGCFDGHGGDAVSKHLAQHMTQRVSSQLQARDASSNAAAAEALAAAFGSIDRELRLAKTARLTGSTAVVALVTNNVIHIASCGDSRAVICQGCGAFQPVQDHTPLREDERDRIQRLGGQILQRNGMRVMGALAMCRAIGDHALRPYGVIAEPEVAHYERCSNDDYLLLASDGLWNVLSNKDVACIIQLLLLELVAVGLSRSQISALLPKILTRIALQRGSTDNITVITLDISQHSNINSGLPQIGGNADKVATDACIHGCPTTDISIQCEHQKACPNLLNNQASCGGDSSSISTLALQRIKQIIQRVSSSKWDSSATAAAIADGSWSLQAKPSCTAVNNSGSVGSVQMMPSVGVRQSGQSCALSHAAAGAAGAVATPPPATHSIYSEISQLPQQQGLPELLCSSPGIQQTQQGIQQNLQQTSHYLAELAHGHNHNEMSTSHGPGAPLQSGSFTTPDKFVSGCPMASPFVSVQQQPTAQQAVQQWSIDCPTIDHGPFSLTTNIRTSSCFNLEYTSAFEVCDSIPPSARKRRLVTTGSAEEARCAEGAAAVHQSCPAPVVCGLQPPNKLQRLGGAGFAPSAVAVPLQPHASWPVQDGTWIVMSASA